MVKSIHIGADCGSSSGAFAWILETNGGMVQNDCIRFKNSTEKEISDKLKQLVSYKATKMFCVVEKAWAMPMEGVTSAFSFGDNVGWIRGVLMTLDIPFDYITAQRWQKEFVPAMEGRKNLNKDTKKELNWEVLNSSEQKEIEKRFKAHNLLIKNDYKKKLKEKAEYLFPSVKVVSDNADALLLAYYCKKYH